MKTLTVLLSLLFFTGISFAQEEQVYTRKELKTIKKEERKAQQKARDEENRKLTDLMLKSHRFVLEADYLSNGKGQRMLVQSNLNFIAIDSIEATIQLARVSGVGYNGVGGITVDGRVTKYDLKVIQGKKDSSYTLTVFIMTSLGTYDITFMISSTGTTDATIRGTTTGQIRYNGHLVPIGVSRVYKGRSI